MAAKGLNIKYFGETIEFTFPIGCDREIQMCPVEQSSGDNRST